MKAPAALTLHATESSEWVFHHREGHSLRYGKSLHDIGSSCWADPDFCYDNPPVCPHGVEQKANYYGMTAVT